ELESQYPTAAQPPAEAIDKDGDAAPVRSFGFGYVQSVDVASIMDAASSAGALVVLTSEPGDFVSTGSRIASVRPAPRLDPKFADTIRRAFILGSYPSLSHDVEFGIRQIADIGVKALSSAINDPTTATSCVDHLGVILSCAITRYEPARTHLDREGVPRVVSTGPSVEHMMHLAFDQMRHYGRGDRRVLTRILAVLGQLTELTNEPSRLDAIREITEQVARAAESGLEDDDERRAVLDLTDEILARLKTPVA
ncbi:MAG TPA: DUF2254 family protein, partial [Dehalococcoidia bacterium]|nr:DUF2254 family protein [Dehalococcoidia bacterium]